MSVRSSQEYPPCWESICVFLTIMDVDRMASWNTVFLPNHFWMEAVPFSTKLHHWNWNFHELSLSLNHSKNRSQRPLVRSHNSLFLLLLNLYVYISVYIQA